MEIESEVLKVPIVPQHNNVNDESMFGRMRSDVIEECNEVVVDLRSKLSANKASSINKIDIKSRLG